MKEREKGQENKRKGNRGKNRSAEECKRGNRGQITKRETKESMTDQIEVVESKVDNRNDIKVEELK